MIEQESAENAANRPRAELVLPVHLAALMLF